jgi:hypothetical protein
VVQESGQIGFDDLDEMEVTNPTMALELLAKDAHPLQQYRELTQNAIETIQSTRSKTGTVLWDVDWSHVEHAGVYRLACIDDGRGMTEEEMRGHLNTLFSSGREQGVAGNFGVGGKVTAGARNPAGVAYFSWTPEEGGLHCLFRRAGGPGSRYGLHRETLPDGTTRSVFPHSWEPVKPGVIDDHGTVVVLHGETGEEDTILPPPESPSQSMKWLAKYLGTRYFRFPEGITVRVSEFPAEQTKWPRRKPQTDSEWRDSGIRDRRVQGMGEYLDRYSERGRGHVELEGAVAHWWILDDALTGGAHEINLNRGHTAALFQSELYDVVDQQRHRLQMQGFGILYAARRVVVYIEPTVSGVTANTARSSLTIRGSELPWESWGKQFGSRLPREIRELEREVRDATAERDHAKSIQERLRRYKHLWKVTSWRANQVGPDRANGVAPSGASRPQGTADPSEGEPGDRPQPLGAEVPGGRGTQRNDYLSLLQAEGQPAERINPDRDIPKVDWVDFEEDGDRPRDRAAEYVRGQNVIFANTRFRVFTDMINRFTEELGGMHDDAPSEIRDTVREWYEQVLVEAVLRSWSFEHEAPWQRQQYEQLTSPEALTLAVLPFTFVHEKIKGSVRSRLGALAGSVSA